MTNHKIQFVGAPCGHHGNYTFYKAFKYTLHGKQKILSLGEFFFVKIWEEEDIISVGEAQLLWEDRSSGQILVSLRIYFLPENTPDGRCDDHGEHEVVSLSEKVVLRAEDVIGWMRGAVGVKWDVGLLGVYSAPLQDPQNDAFYTPPISGALDIAEINREKKLIGDVVEPNSLHIIILAFDKYCRIRGLLKRLEGVEEEYMRSRIVVALGGFVVPSRRTRMLFCRDVFDYPELEGHDLLCNHLYGMSTTDPPLVSVSTPLPICHKSPKLQGRPRKKRKKPTDSESESSEASEDTRPRLKGKPGLTAKPNGLRVLDRMERIERKSSSSRPPHHLNQPPIIPPPAPTPPPTAAQVNNDFSTPALNRLFEVDFMSKLHKFMKDRNSPITRLPHIGYKQLNVYEFFSRVQQLGGFECVNEKKVWKQLYEEMSGNNQTGNPPPSANSYASMMKRHYERLLLPYEKFLRQEQKKMLGMGSSPSKPSKQPKSEPAEPSVSILQHHIPEKCGKYIGGPHMTHPMAPMAPEGLSGPLSHGGRLGPSPPVGTPPRASPAPPTTNISPPATPIELAVPKVNVKKESSGPGSGGNQQQIPADLAKRPEITITPIPRTVGGPDMMPPGMLDPSVLPPLGPGLKNLQLADLMTLEGLKSTLGMSALQDLAKIAERYERPLQEPMPKKLKTESSRVNGTSSRDKDGPRPSVIQEPHMHHHKPTLPAVPGLVPAEVLRQMNLLDTKLLLPAHQSNKTTISALAQLLPQTSIFPAPAPAAHQHPVLKSSPRDPIRQEPPRVFQSPSVYSQSKHMYGKPNADMKDYMKDSKSSSPEIEILDLSSHGSKKNNRQKTERPEIELLDLSTRRDITVSSVAKPGTSKNHNSGVRIPPPHVSIKSSEPPKHSPSKHQAAAAAAGMNALAAAGLPHGLAGLPINPAALLPYLTPMLAPKHNSGAGGPLSMFPYVDPTTLAAYYSMLPHSLLPPTSSSGGSGSAASAAAAAQHMAATQLQLNSLGLPGLSTLSPEALASLGMYKNFLPQQQGGSMPPTAPHFLSGLMSPHGQHPPTTK